MISRVAIVNRGEAAMRLIHAVRELNAQGGAQIETIALHTDGESAAKFVREADSAYAIGPASARPYLDHAVLERALRETAADAAWVGWGFVAEDPAFAELCQKVGVTFIGPSAEAMRQLGDKIGAKLLAEEAGVPVAPWSRGAVDDVDAATVQAKEIGYPLMLKATAGGGGRGIRVVTSDSELVDAFARTRDEAQRAFGSGVVFLERLVTGARHIEVQVIADGQGTAWAIGVRDCSLQRRNQKVIEESASPVLTAEQVASIKESAERLALSVGYQGAATVEFLYEPSGKTFSFLEVNTRLQVEHPITEVTTGFDLVKAQLHVAAGGRLEGARPTEIGHAVEARLNAEDPDRDFAPSPGRIAYLDFASGPGVRVDTGVSEGDLIPADFDSMIAKIIAYGRDRDEALARLRRALADTTVLIEGGATNKSFLLDLLDQPEVVDGSADTGWIDRVRAEGRLVASRHAGLALVAAAITAYEEEEEAERGYFLATAHGGRPQARHEVGRAVDLKLGGVSYRVAVSQVGADRFRVHLGPSGAENVLDVTVEQLGEFTSRLHVGEQVFRRRRCGPRCRAPGRGERHHPPRQPGRGRRPPLPRTGPGRRHTGRGRRDGGGRRSRARAREHEDGDGDPGPVRGPGARADGGHRRPGRDRHADGAARAAHRRRVGYAGGRGAPRAPNPRSTCPRRPGPPARLPALRRCSPTCAACCSASTSPAPTGPRPWRSTNGCAPTRWPPTPACCAPSSTS